MMKRMASFGLALVFAAMGVVVLKTNGVNALNLLPGADCLSFRLSDNDNEAVAAVPVHQNSAQWTAWLKTLGATTAATVDVEGYGPCVYSDKDSTTCYRSKKSVLGTVTNTTSMVSGTGPVPAIGLTQTTACQTIACIGGANHGNACAAASVCPGGYCPDACYSVVSFCADKSINP